MKNDISLLKYQIRRRCDNIVGRLLQFESSSKNQAVVLLFHEVDNRGSLSFAENISPQNFLQLIETLETLYTIISLSEMIERLFNNGVDRPYLSLTFDDGSVSIYTNAYPILKAKNITATVFLTTACVGDENPFWPYVYNYMLNSQYCEKFIAICRSVYGELKITSRTLKWYTNYVCSRAQVSQLIDRVFDEIISFEEYKAVEGIKGRLFLNPQEILKMSDLLDYGIHTATHPNLKKLSSGEIREEFRESLKLFKDIFPQKEPILAIPFGGLGTAYDWRTIKIAKEFNLTTIVSAYGGGNAPRQPSWSIRRIPVSDKRLKLGVNEFVNSIKYMCPRFLDMVTEKFYLLHSKDS